MPVRAIARQGGREVRGAQAASAPSARARPAFRRDAIEHLSDLLLQLIRRRAIDVELRTDRITDRARRRAVGGVLTQQERLAAATECFDALEVMRGHGKDEIGLSYEI